MAASGNVASKLTPDELNTLFLTEFPQIGIGTTFRVETVFYRIARLRMAYGDHMLRPGGTISGPSMFALADVAMFVAVLASVGPVELAVTTSMNINFLRKPGPQDMIADAKILKLGKRLAVGEISLYSEGIDEMVAHATATYSIPHLVVS